MSFQSLSPLRKHSLARSSLASLALLSFWYVTAGASSAWAFWFGTIPIDGVELKGSASDSAPTLQTLSQGMRFSAVDEPANGYYRIRTKSGTGYIDASLVESQNTHHGAVAVATPKPSTQAKTTHKKRSTRKTAETPKWSVSVLLGSTLSNPSNVSSTLGSTSLSDPLGVGLEGAYRLNAQWRLAFRIEMLTKSVTGPDATTGYTFDISMKAWTFMVGADYIFLDTPKYDLFGGVRAGIGEASLSSVATNLASPNETDFSGSALTGLLFVGIDYKAWTHFWFGAEAGYRALSTPAANPTTTGAGSQIWTTPIGLAFSGLYGALNVRILF